MSHHVDLVATAVGSSAGALAVSLFMPVRGSVVQGMKRRLPVVAGAMTGGAIYGATDHDVLSGLASGVIFGLVLWLVPSLVFALRRQIGGGASGPTPPHDAPPSSGLPMERS